MATIINTNDIDIRTLGKIKRALTQRKIIIYPADTLYGFGCDYRLPDATRKISIIKKRQQNKSYILLAATFDQVFSLCKKPSSRNMNILRNLWPGAITAILYPKDIPNHLIHDEGVAIRVTSNEWTRNFIEDYGHPLISTSLNISGEKEIEDIDGAESYLDSESWKEVSYIIKDKNLKPGLPSTIVDMRFEKFKILRIGAISRETILKYES